MSCDECIADGHSDFWELFGCGWKDEYRGKGQERSHGADLSPYNRTCENYYWEQGVVQIVLADLEDYRRGSLGNVWDLPATHLDLLRMADNQEMQWSAYYQARMMELD